MKSELLSLKLDLINWISNLDDPNILHSIKDLQSANQTDWWDDLTHEQKQSVEEGLSDVKNGRVHSHDEVSKLFDKWLER